MNFLEIEKGEHGLFYVTSPYVPGLLIAAQTLDDAYRQVPIAIVEMAEEKNNAPPAPATAQSNELYSVIQSLTAQIPFAPPAPRERSEADGTEEKR